MARIFPRTMDSSRTFLALEALEPRRNQSVVSALVTNRWLVVTADNVATSVLISQDSGNVRLQDVVNNRTWDFARSLLDGVDVRGGAGNDRFVNSFDGLLSKLAGNSGNDYLEGNSAADILDGGVGNDTLLGNAGNDTLYGRDGDDLLLGLAGDDLLYGGNDADQCNGGAGNDRVFGEAGNDLFIGIDGGTGDQFDGGAGKDIAWIDQNGSTKDRILNPASEDKVLNVASFANGADRTLDGDRLADPTALAGHTYAQFANRPLFATSGPTINDVRQGGLGDCYLLAGLAAVAKDTPQSIRQNIVDFHDGTFGVMYGGSFYRVDNDLAVSSAGSSTPAYAQLGAQNSLWVAIAEKAYAFHRNGAGTFASIEGGMSLELNRAWGSSSAGMKWIGSYASTNDLANDLASRVAGGQAVTIGISSGSGANLVAGHMYTVARVDKDRSGRVTGIVLRNPWGVDNYTSTDGNNDGYVTVTPDQLRRYVGVLNWGRV